MLCWVLTERFSSTCGAQLLESLNYEVGTSLEMSSSSLSGRSSSPSLELDPAIVKQLNSKPTTIVCLSTITTHICENVGGLDWNYVIKSFTVDDKWLSKMVYCWWFYKMVWVYELNSVSKIQHYEHKTNFNLIFVPYYFNLLLYFFLSFTVNILTTEI